MTPAWIISFNEKIQITKFLPKNFFRDFQQILMSLVKIGQNKWKKEPFFAKNCLVREHESQDI